MSSSTPVETIKVSKKHHRCSWCWQRIEVGTSYKRWRWFDGGDASTIKEHPECYEAMEELCKLEPDYLRDGWTPGEFPRGCICEDGKCERCEKRRAVA